MFSESGVESANPNTPAGSRGSPAPVTGTEGGSLADLSSSLSQSIEDMSEDMVSYCHMASLEFIERLPFNNPPEFQRFNSNLSGRRLKSDDLLYSPQCCC